MIPRAMKSAVRMVSRPNATAAAALIWVIRTAALVKDGSGACSTRCHGLCDNGTAAD